MPPDGSHLREYIANKIKKLFKALDLCRGVFLITNKEKPSLSKHNKFTFPKKRKNSFVFMLAHPYALHFELFNKLKDILGLSQEVFINGKHIICYPNHIFVSSPVI